MHEAFMKRLLPSNQIPVSRYNAPLTQTFEKIWIRSSRFGLCNGWIETTPSMARALSFKIRKQYLISFVTSGIPIGVRASSNLSLSPLRDFQKTVFVPNCSRWGDFKTRIWRERKAFVCKFRHGSEIPILICMFHFRIRDQVCIRTIAISVLCHIAFIFAPRFHMPHWPSIADAST